MALGLSLECIFQCLVPMPSSNVLSGLMDSESHAELLVSSFHSLLGREMLPSLSKTKNVPNGAGLADLLLHAEAAILSHDTQADPVFTYGNNRALQLFEISRNELLKLPSRKSAELMERGERLRMLNSVNDKGYIDDYKGVRVSATGRRFWIENAVVWKLIDQNGVCRGQAAMFDHWTFLQS